MSAELNKRLKDRLAKRDAMVVAGCPNALTARLVEDLGYEAIYVTGAGVTNMNLGMPDLSFITLDMLCDVTAAMSDCTNLPIIVDADTGFGNAVNTEYTVKRLERAGASCIQIEDQLFPKKCGHFAGKAVVEKEEWLNKIKAAVNARSDENLMIMARTDARACTSFEDAADRARSAHEAGADFLFVEAPQSLEEIKEIPKIADAPFMINLVYGGKTPILSREELAEMGYAMTLYANAGLQSAVQGMNKVLGHILKTGSIDGVLDDVCTFEVRQNTVNKPYYDELEQKYAE
ncbi:MAG: isocitrate lyase/PEP mutase family protein [Rhodospirillales bacterium]|jgi:2-methylisocitrate lyase-like PEP mutase family enzyme